MKKRHVLLAFALIAVMLAGCVNAFAASLTGGSAYTKTSSRESVTLVVAGPWNDCRALELVAAKFTALNPNCEVTYEYLQDFDNLITKRLGGDAYAVDLFFTNNILRDTPLTYYALDLYSEPSLDFSNTFDGLRRNFSFIDESGAEKLYAMPLGAEMRGLFVNKTLLKSLGLSVPTNQEELFAACEVLKQAGYIPFQGNPGYFGQRLMYPYACSLIANAPDYDAVYARVAACEAGVSELFRPPLEFLYTCVERGYYDYKAVEATKIPFTDGSDEGVSKNFLSIYKGEDGEMVVPDVGVCAFFPGALSQKGALDKVKEDYHSPIEYEFVLAPVGEHGGYAYMSPARGIAINKSSSKLDWALEFMQYLFTPEINEQFAKAFYITPNVVDAPSIIIEQYGASVDRVCELGQVSFNYAFYGKLNEAFVEISKANNPKYMVDDGAGGLKMVTLDEFMARLEARFESERAAN